MKRLLTSIVAVSLLLAGVGALGREPPHFPQELPWTGKPAETDHRARLQSVVLPEFVFAGDFEDAIDHLRNEFRKHAPNGGPLGKFVISSTVIQPKRLDLRLRGRNTLEIIDNLCALCRCNWALQPHAIFIGHPTAGGLTHELQVPGKVTPGLSKPVIDGMTLREWYAAKVFPQFKYSGTLDGAIDHLMAESRQVAPLGHAVGGFIVRSGEVEPALPARALMLDLKDRNALEIIDVICGATSTTWTFGPSILIQEAKGGTAP